MKIAKKISCFIMATFVTLSMGMVGCSKQTVANTETDLTISFWKSGYGDQYIKNIVADFQVAYPEYKVDLQSSTDGFVFANTIEHGADMNAIDLYIGSFMDTPYNENTEPLNGLLEETCYGETVTVGAKLGQSYTEALTHKDGNIYGLTEVLGTYQGLVYNADIIGEGTDYNIPVTTDELELLVIDLLDDDALSNVYPFIHYGQGDYWQRVYQQWWVQYDGIDGYYDFIALKDSEGNTPSKSVLTKEDGRYQAVSVLESVVSKDTVYPGSNKLAYQDAQTRFMNGAAVMMANGGWLVNEMKSNSEATATNLRMMRTPVISALAYPDENGYDRLPSVDDDEELAAAIRKMDEDIAFARGAALSGNGFNITQEDYDRIYEARYLSAPGGDNSLMVIPAYATAKNAAKDFIKFMYSDEQVKKTCELLHTPTYLENTQFVLDASGWLEFERDITELSKHTIPVFREAVGIKSPMFTIGGLQLWNNSPIVAFCQTDNLNKEEYWAKLVAGYENAWNNALRNVQTMS